MNRIESLKSTIEHYVSISKETGVLTDFQMKDFNKTCFALRGYGRKCREYVLVRVADVFKNIHKHKYVNYENSRID
jgi:hypothetical protein